MTDKLAVPGFLKGAGLALWEELNETYGFGPHEKQLAAELCQTVTLIEKMAKRIDAEGMTIEGQRGERVNPLLAEIRQQRAVAARLTAALGIPATKGPQ